MNESDSTASIPSEATATIYYATSVVNSEQTPNGQNLSSCFACVPGIFALLFYTRWWIGKRQKEREFEFENFETTNHIIIQ